MRNWFVASIVAVVSLFVFSSVVLGQGKPSSTTSNQPFDPHDLTGLWNGIRPNDPLMNEKDVPMTPAGLAYYRNQQAGTSNPPVNGPDMTDPVFQCEPSSVPRNYFNTHPMEIDQTPTRVIQLFEAWRNFRIFYLDGRPQPKDAEPTWYGDSVAHWEGNTLVVETIDFNGRSWIDQFGHPTSDQLSLVERFTRTDHDHLEDEITITDPVNYTKPWGGKKRWVLRPNWQIEDYLCSPREVHRLDNIVTDPVNAGDPLGLKKK